MELLQTDGGKGDVSQFAMVPEELLRDKRLDTKEKMVLIVLLFHRHSKTGECYPAISTICEMTGLSKMTVHRVLTSLEEKKIIKRKRRYTVFGDYDSNGYTFTRWYQGDTTWYQGDTTVVSGGYQGWYQADTQSYDLIIRTDQIEQPQEPDIIKPPEKEDPVQKQKPSSPSKVVPVDSEKHKVAVEKAFGVFREIYPENNSKNIEEALREWKRIFFAALGVEAIERRFQNVCGHAVIYAKEMQNREKRYVKYPENWLRSIDPDAPALIETEVWVREEEEPA